MNGELAQAVALVAHGNAALSGRGELDLLEVAHSTFRFVRSLSFEVPSRWRTRTVDGIADWVRVLRRVGVDRLSLVGGATAPAPFVDQGGWGVLGHAPERTWAWSGDWDMNREAVDPVDPTPQIWEVTYRLVPGISALRAPDVDLPAAAAELRGALEEARDFATRDHDLRTFAQVFAGALEVAADPDPVAPHHHDMLPPTGYPGEARRLLATATSAWVFGGMGSWNDVGYDDEQSAAEHHHISARLYQAVLAAVCEAANSFES